MTSTKLEILFEQEYWDDVAGTTGTLLATTNRGRNKSLAGSPGFYQPVLQQAGSIQRDFWTDDQVFGSGKMALGDVTLNALALDPKLSPPYDFLIAHRGSTSRRPGRLLAGSVDATSYSEFQPFMAGSSDGFAFSDDGSTLTFRWRDGIADLIEDTGQLGQFAGTGMGEGGADIAGRWKPRVVPGYQRNIELVCVDTAKFIYFVHHGSVVNEARWKIYVKGAERTADTQRATYADLDANIPGASVWDYVIADTGTYIRFAAQPAGAVTADVVVGATSADRTIAQAFKTLLSSWGVAAASISAADVAAFDAVQTAEPSYVMGTNPERRRDVLDKIVGSGGGIYYKDPTGIWRIKRVAAPTGSPALTFRWLEAGQKSKAGEIDIKGLAPVLPQGSATGTAQGSNGEPVKSTTLRYGWIPKVQGADELAGAASAATVNFVSLDWRFSAPAENATIAAHYLGARLLVEDFYSQDATAAGAERDRRQTLRGQATRDFNVTAMMDAASLAAVQELAEVRIYAPRFGLDAGKLGIAGAASYDAAKQLATFLVRVYP